MKPAKLTAKVLSALKPGERVRDTVVRGLFAERGVRGVSLKVQADLRQPGQPVRTVKQTLGHHGPDLSLEAARTRAQGLLSTIKSGTDPRAPAADPTRLTVRGMFEAYAADLRIHQRAGRTIVTDPRITSIGPRQSVPDARRSAAEGLTQTGW